MDVLYTWKTIKADCFTREVLFTYGNTTSESLDDWNSIHEDLLISITIIPFNQTAEIESCFFPGETYGMVFSWKGDNRFSGGTPFLDYRPESALQFTYVIPKGSCGSNIEAECNLVIREAAAGENGDWYRPPGSIIGTIPIIEKIKIDKGAWFPVEEFEGDGSVLLRWEFVNMDNLDLSVSSCFLVLVDKKHPMAPLLGSGPEGQSLLTLMIVQGVSKKALTEEVFDQLKQKQETGDPWIAGSAGACFDFILKRLLSGSGYASFYALKHTFQDAPERIDEIVDKVFSAGFLSSFRK